MVDIQAFNWKHRIALVTLAAAALLAPAFVSSLAQPPVNLEVSFLNVGLGDAALLRDSSGFVVLIDGGGPSAGSSVTAFLRAQGVAEIDVMVATHADNDHIGGLIKVLEMEDIPVRAVIYNGYPGSSSKWIEFMAAVAAEGLTPIVAQYPQTFQWGEMTAQVLNPVSGLDNPQQNPASLVLRIDIGNESLLFAGDIDATVEAQILARGTPVAARVLKVAHHGDAGSSSAGFLAAVSPSDSVISVGPNGKDRPAPETIQRLLDAGSRVWRTDLDDSVPFSIDGQVTDPTPSEESTPPTSSTTLIAPTPGTTLTVPTPQDLPYRLQIPLVLR